MSNMENGKGCLVNDVPHHELSVVYPYQLDDYRCVSPIDDVYGPLLSLSLVVVFSCCSFRFVVHPSVVRIDSRHHVIVYINHFVHWYSLLPLSETDHI